MNGLFRAVAALSLGLDDKDEREGRIPSDGAPCSTASTTDTHFSQDAREASGWRSKTALWHKLVSWRTHNIFLEKRRRASGKTRAWRFGDAFSETTGGEGATKKEASRNEGGESRANETIIDYATDVWR